MKAAAVIVAGGQGRRYGGAVRKQYLRLRGRPLLWWSVRAFERAPSVRSLIIVVPSDDVKAVRRRVKRWAPKKEFHVVAGGAERQDSVRQGLAAVDAAFAWVAVHDAVRPLIDAATIEAVIRGARATGAAVAAAPSKDTVKIASPGGHVQSTPPRERVWMAQTPQVVRRDLLLKAHRAAGRFIGTDDVQLVERIGVRVRLVKSPAENIKVTVPLDLMIAQKILKGR